MNTLRDTDERKARPSVWPVYVAAAVMGLGGLACLSLLVWSTLDLGLWPLMSLDMALLGVGLGAVIGAVGLARLRRWGWWYAVVLTCISTACLASFVSDWVQPAPPNTATTTYHAPDPEVVIRELVSFGVPWLTTILVLVWVLTTRRQLFFPSKQEGEE